VCRALCDTILARLARILIPPPPAPSTLPVLLAFIPLRMPRPNRQQRHRFLLLPAQQNRRRNQIPHIFRNHIRGKKVDLLQPVWLAAGIRLELAKIPILRAAVRRFHLNSQDPRARLNAHIVSRRISPRLRHLESFPQSPRHELQLHPLAPLLESPEPLAVSHRTPPRSEICLVAQKKGAAHGPRLVFLKIYVIYLLYQIGRVNCDTFLKIFIDCCEPLSPACVLLCY
jgi:hypothetical protein